MSLLELILAHVIWFLMELDEDTGAIVTGGLDILPRVNMAINLAEHMKAPRPICQSLRDVRKKLQDGLLDRRNQAVHGAHLLQSPTETKIKMLRWPHPKRHQVVTSGDLVELARSFNDLTEQCDKVWSDLADWKFGPGEGHRNENSPNRP